MERHRTLLLLAEAPARSCEPCEPKEPAGESLKDMEVIDEYIADPESDQETAEKEPPSCKPQDPAVKEQPSCGPEEPAVKEQPSCGPEEPAVKEQPLCGPEEPAVKDQPLCGLQDPVEEHQSSPGPQKEVADNGVTAMEIAKVPIVVGNNESTLDKMEKISNMEKYQEQSQGSMPREGAGILKDAEIPSRSQSPSDSWEIQDSVSQYSGTSAADLNQERSVKRAKKRRHSSSSEEDKRRSNYAEILTTMLNKRLRVAEPLLDYFYGKMYLINNCGIRGRNAVECILHGLGDNPLRYPAEAKQFRDPDDLLEYLKTAKINCVGKNEVKKKKVRTVKCFNCEEFGHFASDCPKPIKKCDKCNKIGHTTKTCYNEEAILTQLEKKTYPNRIVTDHKNYNYPQPKKRCGLCFKLGHFCDTCRKLNKLIQKETKILVCFNCQTPGHKTRECREPKVKCEFCSQLGHSADVCKLKPEELTTDKRCYKCNQVGHTKSACPTSARNYDHGTSHGNNDNYIPVKMSVSNNSSTNYGAVVQKTEEKKTPSPWIWS